jgi:hypothetical protein
MIEVQESILIVIQKGRTYHAVVLKDGSASIQTTVEHFGRDIVSVGEDVEDQL